MSKLELIKKEIQDLESRIELKRVELKHEEEKEAICAEKDAAFKSAILAQLRTGELTELGALQMCEDLGIEATEEIEQTSVKESNNVTAI